MTERTDRAIAALRTGHDRLVHVVKGMTVGDFHRGSAAREWTIAEVLSHLGSGAEIMLATLDGALGAGPAPVAGFRESVWDRWNAMAAQDQAAGFIRSNEALVERFEGLDRPHRDNLRVDLGFLPQPIDVATTASMRLNEFTFHTWDITVVSDRTATLAPEAVEFLFEPLRMLIGWIAQPDAFERRPLTLAVHTTAPDRSFGLELGESATIVDVPADATASLHIPAEALLRLTAGRLAPSNTPPATRLDGNAITLDDLRRIFPGF